LRRRGLLRGGNAFVVKAWSLNQLMELSHQDAGSIGFCKGASANSGSYYAKAGNEQERCSLQAKFAGNAIGQAVRHADIENGQIKVGISMAFMASQQEPTDAHPTGTRPLGSWIQRRIKS
jgi:hypothetical protein